jgi:hypothetical protein
MITRPGHAGEPAVRLFAELAGTLEGHSDHLAVLRPGGPILLGS